MEQKKVLVVEDEDILRKALEQRLVREGIHVLAATDGKEGLDIAMQHRPDLILLDIMMPHDGIEMIVELRKDEVYGRSAPVIFLSNLSPDSDRIVKAIEEQEPVFYLVKANNTLEQIAEKVLETLSERQ